MGLSFHSESPFFFLIFIFFSDHTTPSLSLPILQFSKEWSSLTFISFHLTPFSFLPTGFWLMLLHLYQNSLLRVLFVKSYFISSVLALLDFSAPFGTVNPSFFWKLSTFYFSISLVLPELTVNSQVSFWDMLPVWTSKGWSNCLCFSALIVHALPEEYCVLNGTLKL